RPLRHCAACRRIRAACWAWRLWAWGFWQYGWRNIWVPEWGHPSITPPSRALHKGLRLDFAIALPVSHTIFVARPSSAGRAHLCHPEPLDPPPHCLEEHKLTSQTKVLQHVAAIPLRALWVLILG